MISVLLTIAVVGVTGNAVVIVTILRNYRGESWTYLLMCHLALCDLLTCLIGGPLWITTYVTKIFPLCRTAIFISTIFLLASSMTLVLIAYDRYIYIKYSLRYPIVMTKRRINSLLVIVWALSFGSAFSMVMLLETTDVTNMRHCVATTLVNRWLMLWIGFIFTIVPNIALVFAYSFILRTALRQQRIVQASTRASTSSDVSDQAAKKTKLRKERRTIITLTAVVFVYFVCVMPYSIVGFLDAVSPGILKEARQVHLTSLLVFSNSAINPILYTATNKQLREQVRGAFRFTRI